MRFILRVSGALTFRRASAGYIAVIRRPDGTIIASVWLSRAFTASVICCRCGGGGGVTTAGTGAWDPSLLDTLVQRRRRGGSRSGGGCGDGGGGVVLAVFLHGVVLVELGHAHAGATHLHEIDV